MYNMKFIASSAINHFGVLLGDVQRHVRTYNVQWQSNIVMDVAIHLSLKILMYRGMYSCYVQRHMRILFHEYS